MRFLEKWQTFWMAVSFAEAGEQDTAIEIYQNSQKRPDERVTDRKRPARRHHLYRT